MPLSPLSHRRWIQFKANKRALISLWLLGLVTLLCLLAPLLANDHPLLGSYKGHLLFPTFTAYPETYFDGDFYTEADYRDPYVQKLIAKDGWLLWAPNHFRYDTIDFQLGGPAPAKPGQQHMFGTDDQGRDVVARLLYGARLSLAFALILTVLSTIVGIIIGALQGFFGGWVDLIGQRFIEIWSGLPMLYMLIIMGSFFEPGFGTLLILLLLFAWLNLVGVVRAEFLRTRNFDYVKAARAMGVPKLTIMWRHILPNALIATITYLPFVMTGAITTLTSLDFLGLGLPPGSPSLGEMLSQAKANLQAPWLGITIFVALAALLSLFNFIGEGVRDAFDPRRV